MIRPFRDLTTHSASSSSSSSSLHLQPHPSPRTSTSPPASSLHAHGHHGRNRHPKRENETIDFQFVLSVPWTVSDLSHTSAPFSATTADGRGGQVEDDALSADSIEKEDDLLTTLTSSSATTLLLEDTMTSSIGTGGVLLLDNANSTGSADDGTDADNVEHDQRKPVRKRKRQKTKKGTSNWLAHVRAVGSFVKDEREHTFNISLSRSRVFGSDRSDGEVADFADKDRESILWTGTLALPRFVDFTYKYVLSFSSPHSLLSSLSSEDQHPEASLLLSSSTSSASMFAVEEPEERTSDSERLAQYDLFIYKSHSEGQIRDDQTFRSLLSSTLDPQHPTPCHAFLRWLFLHKFMVGSTKNANVGTGSSNAQPHQKVSHFLEEYRSFHNCALRWRHSFEQFEIDVDQLENIVESLLNEFVAHIMSFPHALGLCCIIGSLAIMNPDRVPSLVGQLDHSSAYSVQSNSKLLKAMTSFEAYQQRIELEICTAEHDQWLQAGLAVAYQRASKSDRYLWLGCLPFVCQASYNGPHPPTSSNAPQIVLPPLSVNTTASSSSFSSSQQLSLAPVEAEETGEFELTITAFKAAALTLRNNGLSHRFSCNWAYALILEGVIRFAPTFDVLAEFLVAHDFEAAPTLGRCVRTFRDKINQLDKLEVVSAEQANYIVNGLNQLFQHRPEIKADELLPNILRLPLILTADVSIVLNIVRTCGLHFTHKPSIQHIEAVRRWIKSWVQRSLAFDQLISLFDNVLSIDFLADYQCLILDELQSATIFVTMKDMDLLHLITGHGVAGLCPVLSNFLTQKGCTIINDIARCWPQDALPQVFGIIVDNTRGQKEADDFRTKLLFALIRTSSVEPTIHSLLTNPIWYHFIHFYLIEQRQPAPALGCEDSVAMFEFETNLAANTLQQLNNLILRGVTIFAHEASSLLWDNKSTIGTIKLALEHRENLMLLLNLYGDQGIDPTFFNSLEEDISKWERNLDQLHTSVAFFCSDPAYFDADTSITELAQFRENKSSHVFADVKNKFASYPLQDVAWLYDLRTSELFLTCWKSVCSSKQHELLVSPGSLAKFDVQKTFNILLPAIKDKWQQWFTLFDLKRIKFPQLEDMFTHIADTRIQVEITMLWNSSARLRHSTQQRTDASYQWIQERTDLLLTFRRWLALRHHIPSLLRLIKTMAGSFRGSVQTDENYQQITSIQTQLSKNWETQSLDRAVQFQKPVQFLEDIPTSHLVFVSELSASPELLEWLMKHKATDEFNSLLGVCKSNTDNVVVLESLACLLTIRTLLSGLLYRKEDKLYANLYEFKTELCQIQVAATDATQKVIELRDNFSLLLSVFEEKTRSPGVQAAYDLQEIFNQGYYILRSRFEAENIVSCIIKVKDRAVKSHNLQSLIDLRNKLLLATIPNDEDMRDQVHDFVVQLDLLLRIRDTIQLLVRDGHFDFCNGDFGAEIKCNQSNMLLQAQMKELCTIKQDWDVVVTNARSKFYFLNMYTMRQILQIVRALDEIRAAIYSETTAPNAAQLSHNSTSDMIDRMFMQVLSTLRLAHRSLQQPELLSYIRDSWSHEMELSPAQKVSKIGHFLTTLLIDKAPLYRDIPWVMPELRNAVFSEKLSRERFCIITTADSSQNAQTYARKPIISAGGCNSDAVLDAVLSIYAHLNRLPEANELLICDQRTDFEPVSLLLKRWFDAAAHGRERATFCIAGIDRLSYDVQSRLISTQRQLLEQLERQSSCIMPSHSHNMTNVLSCGLLVFIDGSASNNNKRRHQSMCHVSIALAHHVVQFQRLDIQSIRRIYKHISEDYGSEVMAVVSANSGAGKTHAILRRIHKKRMIYHRVPVNESTDVAAFIAALQEEDIAFLSNQQRSAGGVTHLQDRTSPVGFHLDLSHVVASCVNTILFELLITNVLTDRASGRVFHRNPVDGLYFEPAHCPLTVLRRKFTASAYSSQCVSNVELSVLAMVPQRRVSVDESSIDLCKAVLVPTVAEYDEPRSPIIRIQDNDKMQYVCKFLRAFDEGLFQRVRATDRNFDPSDAPNLDNRTCFALLRKYAGQQDRPSFALFDNFVRFMYHQFELCTQYPLLQNVVMVEPLQSFKHVFVDLLIRTSTDFSTRSIERLNDDDDDDWTDSSGSCSPTGCPTPPLRSSASPLAAPISPKRLQEQNVEGYTQRFTSMRKWENSLHPVVVFYHERSPNGVSQQVSGLDFLSTDLGTFRNWMDPILRYALTMNGVRLDRDLQHISQNEAYGILASVAGVSWFDPNQRSKNLYSLFSSYVLTPDNIMKVISIQLRMRYNLPIVLMGETGCGKTELFKFVCTLMETDLHRLNVHGGLTESDIVNWMIPYIEEAQSRPDETVVLFFDELNTCNCMGLFKGIICDHVLDNQPLPENLKILAACNPYRLRRVHNNMLSSDGKRGVGLVYSNPPARIAVERNYFARLVYKVYPLPESLIEYIFDFGALSPEAEKAYVLAMLQMELPFSPQLQSDQSDQSDQSALSARVFRFFVALCELILVAQSYIRDAFREQSAVSLRDVKHCIGLYRWFWQNLCARSEVTSSISDLDQEKHIKIARRCSVLAIAHCYFCRLSVERKEFLNMLEKKSKSSCSFVLQSLAASEFEDILLDEQQFYTRQMNVGPNIAMNDALRENIFMVLVSILNHIPIFVVGKSGSSKSLAIEIISSSLHGPTSSNQFLCSLPAVQMFSYQCSPLSDPHGIQQTFQAARRYQKNTGAGTIVVVLLNEVGLAEQSPHLPLKVLHKELEDPIDVAFVGLSNWILDPSIINRGVFLARPCPTVEDLRLTTTKLVQSKHLESTVSSLAKAYLEVYTNQPIMDFFGLRDFYSLVKYINRNLQDGLTAQLLQRAIARNFGGRPGELSHIMATFFNCVGLSMNEAAPMEADDDVLSCIRANLEDHSSRFLMILTKFVAALDILFDQKILEHDTTDIIFGSDFEKDQSDLGICLNIQRIKHSMAEGRTLVLVNCNVLYESLYDLFNQVYIEYQDKRFVSLGLGTHSRQCVVHQRFKVIVIVDQDDAYKKLAPPMLNRFEKQVLLRTDILNRSQHQLVEKIALWMNNFDASDTQLNRTFVGYHAHGYLDSLALSFLSSHERHDDDMESVFERATSQLLWVASADGVARSRTKHGDKYLQRYFQDQCHRNLATFLAHAKANPLRSEGFSGLQIMVLTFSPSTIDVAAPRLQLHGLFSDIRVLRLHETRSATEFSDSVTFFFDSAPDDALLVIQCDRKLMSQQRVQHSQFVVECIRGSYYCRHDVRQTCRRNIVYVVHVNPRRSESDHTFDFDTRWRYIFIDQLHNLEEHVIPDTEDMLTRSVSELFQPANRLVDLRKLIIDNFRQPLSLLEYPEQKQTQFSVTNRIQIVSKLLADDEFWKELENAIVSNIHVQVREKNWSAQLACSFGGGTFHAALATELIKFATKAFTLILCELDRNSNLAIYANATSSFVRRKWLELWKEDGISGQPQQWANRGTHSIIQLARSKSAKDTIRRHFQVQTDGAYVPFVARFPFSFRVCRAIHQLRHGSELAQSTFGHSLGKDVVTAVPALSQISQEMVLDYIHDYMCIFGDYCGSLDEQQRYCIIATLIALRCKQRPFGIAEAQAWIWKEELRLRAYYAVLDAIHDPALIVAQAFVEEVKSRALRLPCSVGDIDVLLFDILFSVIDPSFATGLRKQRVHSLASANNLASMNNIVSALSGSLRGKLSVSQQQGTRFIFEWMKQVEKIRLPFDLLVSALKGTISDSDSHLQNSLLRINLRWKCIHLFQDFVEEIGIPFSLSPASCLAFWTAVVEALDEHGSLTSSASSFSLSSDSSSMTEPLTSSEHSVTTSTEHDGCLCSFAVFKAILSFLDALLDEETSLEQRPIGDEATVRLRFSGFLEKYLVAYCFCDRTPVFVSSVRASHRQPHDTIRQQAAREQQILSILGRIVADKHVTSGAGLDLSNLPKVQLADSLQYSILRILLSSAPSDLTLKTAIYAELEPILNAAFCDQSGTSSTLLSTVVHVMEDLLISQNMPLQQVNTLLQPEVLELSIHSIEGVSQMAASTLELLQQVAVLRRALCLLSAELISEPANIVATDVNTSIAQQHRLSPLLQILSHHGNLRVFFLRELVALRGYGYMLQPAVRDRMKPAIPWIAEVLQDVKMPDLVPYHNLLFAAYRSYAQVADAINSVVSNNPPSNSTTNATKALKLHEDKAALLSYFLCSNELSTAERRSLLILAVFREVHLSYSDEAMIPKDGIARLTSYLRESGYLGFLNSDERDLLITFCNNKWAPCTLFEIDRTIDSRRLTLLYVIIHVCIVASTLGGDDNFLWRLVLDPVSFRTEFLPTMPDDMSREVFIALHDQGNFFRCQNGHIFFVGECGGPMERSRCPECRCVIGGKDHVLDPSNSRIETNPEQLTGYAIHTPEDEKVHSLSVRSLDPITFRIIRIILHSLLALSMATSARRAEQIDQLIHRQYPKPPNNMAVQYFVEHLSGDWASLRKLLNCTDEQASLLMFEVLQQYMQHPPRGFSRLSTPQRRNEWETDFQRHVRAVVSDKRRVFTIFSHPTESRLQKLLTPDVDAAPAEMALDITFRARLWQHRTPITFDLLSQYLPRNASGLLVQFVKENQLLSALRYIPSMIKWLRMLVVQFHHKVDRNYARDHTIRDAINRLGSWHERKEFDGVFRDICAAWKLCLDKIERFECTELPDAFKSMELSDQTQLSFLIPDERDESICFLALLRFMFEKHNQILEKAHEVSCLSSTPNNDNGNRIGNVTVSPTHEIEIAQFAEHHAIKFDLEREFVPFLQAHARVSEADSSQQENRSLHLTDPAPYFDFDKIEQFIIKQFLSGKPHLKWDNALTTFPFIEERKPVANMAQLDGKVPQRELSSDMKRNIMAAIDSVEHARRCVSVVETCISFLLASSGGGDQHQAQRQPRIEEVPIHTYISDVLLMSTEHPDVPQQATAASSIFQQGMHLQHLRSLWNTLHAYLNNDMYADVRPKYRATLDEALVAILKDRATRGLLELSVLIPCLQEFVTSALLEDYLSGTEPLKTVLGFMPVPSLEPSPSQRDKRPEHDVSTIGGEMSEVPWFATHFPEGIRVEHALHVLQLLQGLLRTPPDRHHIQI